LVPPVGLEPTLREELDFESSASTIPPQGPGSSLTEPRPAGNSAAAGGRTIISFQPRWPRLTRGAPHLLHWLSSWKVKESNWVAPLDAAWPNVRHNSGMAVLSDAHQTIVNTSCLDEK
jgi:hypothetical protein